MPRSKNHLRRIIGKRDARIAQLELELSDLRGRAFRAERSNRKLEHRVYEGVRVQAINRGQACWLLDHLGAFQFELGYEIYLAERDMRLDIQRQVFGQTWDEWEYGADGRVAPVVTVITRSDAL